MLPINKYTRFMRNKYGVPPFSEYKHNPVDFKFVGVFALIACGGYVPFILGMASGEDVPKLIGAVIAVVMIIAGIIIGGYNSHVYDTWRSLEESTKWEIKVIESTEDTDDVMPRIAEREWAIFNVISPKILGQKRFCDFNQGHLLKVIRLLEKTRIAESKVRPSAITANYHEDRILYYRQLRASQPEYEFSPGTDFVNAVKEEWLKPEIEVRKEYAELLTA